MQSAEELSLAEVLERFEHPEQRLTLESARELAQRGESLLTASTPPADAARIWIEKGRVALGDGDAQSARLAFETARDLADASTDDGVRLTSLEGLGAALQWCGEPEGALACAEKTLELARSMEDRSGVMRAEMTLGISYKDRALFSEALEHDSAALAIAVELGDDRTRALILNNIGNVYSAANDPERAIEFLERSIELKDEVGDPSSYVTRLNVGVALGRLGRDEEALVYYDRANRDALRAKDEHHSVLARVNAGASHVRLGRVEKGIELLEPAVDALRVRGRMRDLGAGLVMLGIAYEKAGRTDEAAHVLDESRALAARTDAADVDARALLALADTHASLGDHGRAYQLVREYADSAETAIRDESSEALARFRAEFENAEQARQILELESAREIDALTNQRDRVVRNASVIGIALCVLLTITGWLVARARVRTAGALGRVNAELTARTSHLERALSEVERLRGLLPVCASCNSIRDEHGEWQRMETYIEDRSAVRFSHSICPPCGERLYGIDLRVASEGDSPRDELIPHTTERSPEAAADPPR